MVTSKHSYFPILHELDTITCNTYLVDNGGCRFKLACDGSLFYQLNDFRCKKSSGWRWMTMGTRTFMELAVPFCNCGLAAHCLKEQNI